MAAASSAAGAALLPRSFGISANPSRLSSARSLVPIPLHGRRALGVRGTATTSRSRIVPAAKVGSLQKRLHQEVVARKQTFSSFDDLLKNADKPVLVDFYATWCGPCQFMVPVLDQISTEMKDELVIVKIDTEKYPDIASQYEIAALPTFIVFQDGKILDRFEGALPANQLIERLGSLMSKKET